MKKLFLTLVVAVTATMSSFAQTDLVATLSHGSTLTTYAGYEALSEAHAAAVDGDIITLSSGEFKAVNIEKAITLRGAGMNLLGVEPTYLVESTATITLQDNSEHALTIEGITFLQNVSITGNNLAPIYLFNNRFYKNVSCQGCNAQFVHCILASDLIETGKTPVNVHCMESVVYSPTALGANPSTSGYAGGTMTLDNCIVLYDTYRLYGATLNNCILWLYKTTNAILPGTSTANNCVSNYSDTFINQNGNNNTIVADIGSLFKTLDSYSISTKYTETFELTEEAAATYLGNDDTQVGIYGGASPFNLTPTNPQVKKFTVNSSTNNSKLSVKINVE